MIEFVPAGNEPMTGEREKTKIRNGMSVAAAKLYTVAGDRTEIIFVLFS